MAEASAASQAMRGLADECHMLGGWTRKTERASATDDVRTTIPTVNSYIQPSFTREKKLFLNTLSYPVGFLLTLAKPSSTRYNIPLAK